MAFWNRKKAAPTPEQPKSTISFFSTHSHSRQTGNVSAETLARALSMLPKGGVEGAMDSASSLKADAVMPQAISPSLSNWYASQGFIGWQMCALLSQHWLVDKACSMPARDATRNGYEVVTVDGDKLDDESAKLLKKYDKMYRVKWNAEQFVRMGRVFGIRIAMFKVQSDDPHYYEYPFNIDGVERGSYKGIAQIDPYWCAPLLNSATTSDPTSIHFYDPDYWIIGDTKVHRSHLCIFRTPEAPDILKPMYLYGGVPVPQQIMERVYAAERTANEGPMLAESKRTNVWLTDMAAFQTAGDDAITRMNDWVKYRDNYGIKLGDKEADQFQQFETSLGDLDSVIMTQYQLVAAAARVPSTKLLGTSPKGFNATGEYEEASYHEELESLQEHDLTPLLERHHMLVMKSFGKSDTETTVEWQPLDAPTSKEVAETNLIKAQAGLALVQSGAITGEDERQRVATDPESGYSQMGNEASDDELLADLELSPDAAEAAERLGIGDE